RIAMLVVKANQKIEHFFLPFRECHGVLLQCAHILGESKAKKQAIKFGEEEIALRIVFQFPGSSTKRERIIPPSLEFVHFGSCRISHTHFVRRHYKPSSIVLCLLIGSPLWNFGTR